MLPSLFAISTVKSGTNGARLKLWRGSKAVMHRIANPISAVRLRAAPPPLPEHPMNADELSAEYDRLRAELKRLLEAPVRDMAAVQKVVDRLDDVHMRFKAAHGLHGNNPNE